MSSRQLACAAAAGCVVGAFVSHRWRRRPAADDGDEAEGEEDHAAARARVWRAIGGAMTAAQLYVGDKLGLYYTVARLCELDGFATSVSVAERAGLKVRCRAAQESEIPNFKGSDLGHFPLVSADFWTSDHLSERSRTIDVFSVTRARGTLTLKRR